MSPEITLPGHVTGLTILDYFLKHESESPDSIFLIQPLATDWKEYSWHEAGETARKILLAMKRQGLTKGDRVAILSQNCAEWIMSDLAIMMGGFISVPLYANVNATTMRDILIHSESRLLLVGKLQPKDWENQREAIPADLHTVAMEGYPKEGITSWENFLREAAAHPVPTLPVLDDTITIIYTSGTTGTPKGVVHTHDSIINALEIASEDVLLKQKGNRFISYLPLSHAAERGLVEFGAMYSGGSISFIESLESFATTIQQVKPTHFFGVPRIWEKFQEKILLSIPQKKLSILLNLPVISSLIKTKIKKSLGLDKAVIMLTGSAPMPPDILVWFQKLELFIQEAYGMSENFNVCTITPKNEIRIGTVGKLIKNQEVLIDPITHEIKQRCKWSMQGYYKDPTQTALTLKDGYLHTGDMGTLSKDGFLTLTGRVKDIFKTAKGEYIVPGKIELEFHSLATVDQACVLGVKYPQPFVIVVLSEIGKGTVREQLNNSLLSILETCNQNSMNYQKLKKVIIVKDEWTIENGLLTPTLKMKRNSLSEKYEGVLSEIYATDEEISWE